METYVVHVTKQCNLDCVYCYEQDKTSTYSWPDVKGFIDNLIGMRTSNEFVIEFLGGEPMINFDLILLAYDYLESFPDIRVAHYIITTNGTILPDQALSFLDNPRITYAISMDGTKMANQLRVFKESRLNSHDAVMHNVHRLLDAGIIPSVHIVSHPYNIHLLARSASYLYSMGLRYIDFGIVESTMVIDKEFAELYISQLKEISDKIKSGELVGLNVGVLSNLKPEDDIRTYLRDKVTGKLIGETYGRSGADVSTSDKYNIVKIDTSTAVSNLIKYMRRSVYTYHNRGK